MKASESNTSASVLELLRYFFNDSWLDGALTLSERIDQGMLAQQIDHARNPEGVQMDGL